MSEDKVEDKESNFQETKGFEENIKKAQLLLEKLIEPEITLSESVAVYKEGLKELELAQKLLDNVKLEFQELAQS